MAKNVSVLTWNIQNYGKLKASLDDIVTAIAKTVNAYQPDLFVMLEVNTTLNATAEFLLERMAVALFNQSGGKYKVCMRSPNTGVEYYAFFVRDTAVTVPLVPVVTGTTSRAGIIGKDGFAWSSVTFLPAQITVNQPTLVDGVAPLLSPDFPAYSVRGRSLGIPDWPGVRLPSLGLFWVPGASGASRLLPIVACHFAANHNVAQRQIRNLDTFSIFQGTGPADPSGRVPTTPLKVKVDLGGGAQSLPVPGWILTGDFNLNWMDPAEAPLYQPIVGSTYPRLGAAPAVTAGTHLTTYYGYSRTMKNTEDLAVNGYDNHFLRNGPDAMSPAALQSPRVVDVPNAVQNRTLKLWESVEHYAELDKKGFAAGQYKSFAVDFAQQLGYAGSFSGSPINVKGALVGGRLVSDHLPVFASFRLA